MRLKEPNFICFSLYSSPNSFENIKFLIDKINDKFFLKFTLIKTGIKVFEIKIKITKRIR